MQYNTKHLHFFGSGYKSEDYLLRKHFQTAATGFATVSLAAGACAPKGIPASVAAAVKEARDNA